MTAALWLRFVSDTDGICASYTLHRTTRLPVILLRFFSSEPANPATCAPRLNPMRCVFSVMSLTSPLSSIPRRKTAICDGVAES